jgi:hypothetical protein
MSTRVRVVVWLGLMFLTGLIAVFTWMPFPAIHPLLMLLPFVAGLLTMWVWNNLRVHLGIEMDGMDREKIGEGDKHKRPGSDRLARLVESLDEDEIVELETLLAAHESIDRRA